MKTLEIVKIIQNNQVLFKSYINRLRQGYNKWQLANIMMSDFNDTRPNYYEIAEILFGNVQILEIEDKWIVVINGKKFL